MQRIRTSADPQARLLTQELSTASSALLNALKSRDHREESLELAREALEAFELLDQGPSEFTVPKVVRDRVRASLELLSEGRIELAHATLRRAGGAFQDHVVRPRRWRH